MNRLLLLIVWTFIWGQTCAYAITFETCSSSNDYLETELQIFEHDRPLYYSLPSQTPWDQGQLAQCLSARLLSSRLQTGRAGIVFRKCHQHRGDFKDPKLIRSSSGRPSNFPRPCRSESLLKHLFFSLHHASRCLQIPLRRWFPLLSLESHGFPNIGNHLNVFGITQTSSIGVRQVELIYLHDRNEKDFTAIGLGQGHKKKASCAAMERALKSPILLQKNEYLNTCNSVAFPLNPLRSLLYGGLLLNYYYAQAELLLDGQLQDLRDLGYEINLGQQDQKRIQETLTYFIYNGGLFRTTHFFVNMIKTKRFVRPANRNEDFRKKWRGFKFSMDRFAETFEKDFKLYILRSDYTIMANGRDAFSQKSRREFANYFSASRRAVSDVRGFAKRHWNKNLRCFSGDSL